MPIPGVLLIADIEPGHLDAVLALNDEHVAETSALSRAALAAMVDEAFAATQAGDGRDGFLIAFAQDAAYESPNFLWFRRRYERFVYVDRIVVAGHARGRGLARAFYEDLFAEARRAGVPAIVCEVNVDPPNPASDAFHDRMGFFEAGRARLTDRAKTVRYLVKAL